MNDPNGLVYYDGEWHLFYQNYPRKPIHANMHWGHAVSRDLIAWTELPIAIAPEDNVAGIWSGSVVIDWKNVTGFQKDSTIHPMIAIYTWEKPGLQEQHMAYSIDRGNNCLIHIIVCDRHNSR
jgi:fructan beta-fructosidase